MPNFIDLKDHTFGEWTVLGQDTTVNKRTLWLCKCTCGTIKPVRADRLTSGGSTSCGCIRNVTHMESKSRLYGVWRTMKSRCNNPSSFGYENYGGRGIQVCQDWSIDYQSFAKWALQSGYSEELTLDRINVNGNYEPNNCTWATPKAQARNRRDTIYLTYDGVTKPLIEWAEEAGLSYASVFARLKRGWSNEKLLSKKGR